MVDISRGVTMHGNRFRAGAACLVLLGSLSGCGGEDPGSGDLPTLQVDFDRTVLDVSFDDTTGRVGYLGVLIAPLPAEPVFFRVGDSGALFTLGQMEVIDQGGGAFWVLLPYPDSVAAGDHVGTLTLEVCRDAACSQRYPLSQSTLEYLVVVYHVVPGLPPLTAAFRVDDQVFTDVNEGLGSAGERTYSLVLASGQVFEVEPSTPFAVVRRRAGADYATLTRLPSTFPALRYSVSLPGTTTATNTLVGRAEDGRTISISLTVTP